MKYRKLGCFAVIVVSLFLSMSVMAQNGINGGPNNGNAGDIAKNVARYATPDKRFIVIGYGGPRDRACAGYWIAKDFVNDHLERQLKSKGIHEPNIRLIDGGYLGRAWIKVITLSPGQQLPKLRTPARSPAPGDCSR